MEVRVNGDAFFAETNQNTKVGGTGVVDEVNFQGDSSDIYIDDLVIWDTTGSAPQNNFMGDLRTDELLPDGDGTTNNFTAVGTGTTNADRVDESPAIDDDTTYVWSATVNDVDLYTFGNLPSSPSSATIFCVQAVLTSKVDTGSRGIRSVMRPTSTNYFGTDTSLATAYGMVIEQWDISPQTSSAWTKSEIDGLESGVEVSS
jgi:hypothetical protein